MKIKFLFLKANRFFLLAFFIITLSNSLFSQNLSHNFFKLQCPEKKWVVFHLFIAKSVYKLSVEASNKANLLKSDSTLDGDLNGGQLDAFRHAYWMATITYKHGKRAAKSLGNAHEKANYKMFLKSISENGTLPDKQSSEMDYFNNSVGIEIGKKIVNLNDDSLQFIIINKIFKGDLVVLKKDNKGNFLDSNDNIIYNIDNNWETQKCIVKSNYRDKKRGY